MSILNPKVNRINPKDQDLSMVQRYLADPLDKTLKFINNAFSAIDSSNNLTTTAALNVTGGITAGSRCLSELGYIPQSSLASAGTYQPQLYAPGSSPGFAGCPFIAPYNGSIAAFTCKPYGAQPTAGTLQFASIFCTTNFSTAAISYSALALSGKGYYQAFTPGAYPFVAGSAVNITVTSAGWTQATGATGVYMTLWVYC